MNRILILDDDSAVLNCFMTVLAQTGRFEVETLSDSTKALPALAEGHFDLLLLDMDMPVVTGMEVLRYARKHHPAVEVVVITGVGDVEMAVEAMKTGAYDYLCKPVDSDRLVTCVERALERARMNEELHRLRERVSEQDDRFKQAFQGFVTQDKKLLRTLGNVEQIARSDNNVLIWGESGTGKELVARALHAISRRADKPFVAVNAAAFASALFDSHFFGHERGAFTGADSAKPGLFEEADGGTLFLDEIGDIEMPVQSKLLRALQSGEYFRLGSTRKRGADVRIIAATNKDLDAEIEEGRFRRDLYYRLNISSIFIPPLRERKGDIELLSYYLLDRFARENGKEIHAIADPVLELLEAHDLPGNVRELENIIASAVVLEPSDTLTLDSLPPYLKKPSSVPTGSTPREVARTLSEVEAEHLRAVLAHTGGNKTAAARILGISRVGLLAKLKRLGLDLGAADKGGHPTPGDPR
ncbi:MAG TPA: sigma-54 dependent transcriptional regulator [Anaeromyxobacteraceae bacterium]|nr:sigma-54 dependent transcriptional regulator [Anaeromyxobacteraceae bacterium]